MFHEERARRPDGDLQETHHTERRQVTHGAYTARCMTCLPLWYANCKATHFESNSSISATVMSTSKSLLAEFEPCLLRHAFNGEAELELQ